MASIDGCGMKIGGKVISLLRFGTIVIILGVLGNGLPGRITGGSVGCGWILGDGGCGPGIIPLPGAGVGTGAPLPSSPHTWSCGKS